MIEIRKKNIKIEKINIEIEIEMKKKIKIGRKMIKNQKRKNENYD